MTTATLHSGAMAPLDHHLRPVTTSSSELRSSSMRVAMLLAMLLASEDATLARSWSMPNESCLPARVSTPLLERRLGEVR